MSNPLTGAGRGRMMIPAAPPGRPIATFRSYLDAQAAVDYLSDQKFPVQHVSIVGTDLKMVERVTGRLTYARVALGGFLSGAYFGGFVGLILALFDGQAGVSAIFPAILIGAAFGVIFGVISFAATGGRRDFTSTSQIVAAQYAVWCADDLAGEATRVLAQMPGDKAQQVRSDNWNDAGQGDGQTRRQWPPSHQASLDRDGRPSQHGQPGERSQQGHQHNQDNQPGDQSSPPTGPTYSEMMARKREAAKAQAEGPPDPADRHHPTDD